MAQTGPQRRVGSSSLTETNAYYDGGFASAGVFTYYIIEFPWVDGLGDEPDEEGKMRIAQSRFTRSGNFNPTVSQGMGGTRVFAPAAGPLTTPALEFEGIIWESNAGPIGPALSIQFGQCELEVRNCLLRGNTAYKSVSNPSNSTLCACAQSR